MVLEVKRIERIRLYPTPRQDGALRFMLDVTRQLYNAALKHRRDAYRMRGISITAKQQYAELTALRGPISRLDRRLSAVYRECQDAVLHRLDLAMQAFFRRCKRAEKPGFPRFKPAARLCRSVESSCRNRQRIALLARGVLCRIEPAVLTSVNN